MTADTPPRILVHCISGQPMLDAGLYCPAYPPSASEDMRLFRIPGYRARRFALDGHRIARLRYMRDPMPGEARAAMRCEAADG